jgi:hypothetical protein
VRQFYPQRLVDDFHTYAPDQALTELYSFCRADLNGTGQADFLVAAYSNGRMGAVRVFKTQSSTMLVDDVLDLPFVGASATIRALDLDGDKKQEIIVSFRLHRETDDWILKWNGTRLISFGATRTDKRGVVHTLLANAEIIDIDGDGIYEIFVPQEDENRVPFETMYSIKNGVLTPTPNTVVIHDRFERHEGDPDDYPVTFSVADTNSPYTFILTNGDASGHQVTSGEIKLNGAVIVNESQFKQKTKTLKISVRLAATNMLQIELRSDPGSFISFVILRGSRRALEGVRTRSQSYRIRRRAEQHSL